MLHAADVCEPQSVRSRSSSSIGVSPLSTSRIPDSYHHRYISITTVVVSNVGFLKALCDAAFARSQQDDSGVSEHATILAIVPMQTPDPLQQHVDRRQVGDEQIGIDIERLSDYSYHLTMVRLQASRTCDLELWQR